MNYNTHMIARVEHDQRVQSLPPVSDYGNQTVEPKSEKQHRPAVRAILTAILHVVMK